MQHIQTTVKNTLQFQGLNKRSDSLSVEMKTALISQPKAWIFFKFEKQKSQSVLILLSLPKPILNAAQLIVDDHISQFYFSKMNDFVIW